MENKNTSKIKKWFFKTCPKSGRIVGINKKNVVLKICFPLLGFTALVWFLIRVVPKPSRIDYPCQQVAAPLALSFLAFFGSAIVGIGSWRKFISLKRNRSLYTGLGVLLIGLSVSFVLYVMSVDNSLMGQVIQKQIDNGTDMGQFDPIDAPNSPMGDAKGIYPGRVSWAFDSLAAVWDGETGLHSDASCNSQTRIYDMMKESVISLTHQSDLKEAWEELFHQLNRKKGKGTVGYRPGEKIAVKINLNNNGGNNIVDATPQSVYALLSQLVDVLGIPQECITVYDAQRRGISAVYNYNQPVFPNVIYQNWGGFVPDVIHYSSEITDEGSMSLARAAYEADYMINMALLKRHSNPSSAWKDSNGQTGITGVGKNHFGSIGKVSPLHLSIRDWSSFRGMGSYNSIVDIMAHERLGGNTLVYFIDALYPTPIHNGKAVKFKRAPFNNNWTSSFFASNDPIAMESVVLDFFHSELPLPAHADNFLHEGAHIGNPPSGIAYKQKALGSLGVHEHWNNPDDRMYTRNLGTGNGIELYRVPLDQNRVAIEAFYADKASVKGAGKVKLTWRTSNASEVWVAGQKVAAAGEMTLDINQTSRLKIEARQSDGSLAEQMVVVRAFNSVADYPVAKAKVEGTFVYNEAGGFVELSGERSQEKNLLTWNIDVPVSGDYYIGIAYKGDNPVPSFLYLNGEEISQNFGYKATPGGEMGEFVMPFKLEKGNHTIQLDHPGRRGNRLYKLFIEQD